MSQTQINSSVTDQGKYNAARGIIVGFEKVKRVRDFIDFIRDNHTNSLTFRQNFPYGDPIDWESPIGGLVLAYELEDELDTFSGRYNTVTDFIEELESYRNDILEEIIQNYKNKITREKDMSLPPIGLGIGSS